MKKNIRFKRITCLALSALLCAGLCACGNRGNGSNGSGSNGNSFTNSNTGTQDTSAQVSGSGQTPSGGTASGSGLLTDEKTTFTVLAKQDADTSTKENDAVRSLEAATNVHLDITWVPNADYSDKVNLLLASGDYPDIITNSGLTIAKQIQYGTREGSLVALNPYIEKYPDGTLATALRGNSAYKAAVTAPDGNIYGFAEVSGGIHGQVTKMWINKSYVEALQMSMPETLDEYHELMLAFKNSDMNQNGTADEVPLTGAVNTWDATPEYFLLSSFIETDPATFLTVQDSSVIFAANTDAYREGLRCIRGMYEEGLIDPTAYTQDESQMRQQVSNEPYTVLSVHCGHLSMAVDTGVQDFSEQWTYLEPLAGPDGVRVCSFHSKELDNPAWSATRAVITDACEDPDLAYRYLDFCTSDEGILLSLGQEGLWWKQPEEGQKGLDSLPALYTNIQPTTPEETTAKAASQFTVFPYLNSRWHSAQSVLSTDLFDPQNYEYRLVDATLAYQPYAPAEILPYNTMQLSEEDNSSLADIKTNILNYVKQMTTLFIIGEKNIDSDWQEYIDTLSAYQLDEYIAINQRGLDTWLAARK